MVARLGRVPLAVKEAFVRWEEFREHNQEGSNLLMLCRIYGKIGDGSAEKGLGKNKITEKSKGW